MGDLAFLSATDLAHNIRRRDCNDDSRTVQVPRAQAAPIAVARRLEAMGFRLTPPPAYP